MKFFHFSVLTLCVLPVFVVFQNCSPVAFAPQEVVVTDQSSTQNSTSGVTLNAFQLVNVELSTPQNFKAEFGLKGDDVSLYEASLDGARILLQADLQHGKLQILNNKTFEMVYTPDFGYRGEDTGTLFLKKPNGEILKMQVRFSIGNSLHQFAPALAIRGSGCVTCHAQVQSNLVTDFGYRGNGQMLDYFFGSKPTTSVSWNSGNIYGDHGSGVRDGSGVMVKSAWQTLKMSSSQKIYVPRAAIPAAPATAWGVTTLAEYIRKVMADSYYPESKSVPVEEKEIFIGAPSQARMRQAFKSAGGTVSFQFFQESANSYRLSGLEKGAAGTYFYNKSDFVCEGDVFIEGSLQLKNLRLNTRTGCRLYVTGSVLISGPITYLQADAPLRNLQISSSKAILMGVGSLLKDDSLCEKTPGLYYFNQWANAGLTDVQKRTLYSSSLLHRLRYIWTTPSFFTRAGLSVSDAHESVIADIEKMGPVYDSSCESTGTDVAFERILLNAPMIHSRYNGDVSGTLISEYAVMRLGKFKFQYDPVFSKVPVLPFLQQEDYLDIK